MKNSLGEVNKRGSHLPCLPLSSVKYMFRIYSNHRQYLRLNKNCQLYMYKSTTNHNGVQVEQWKLKGLVEDDYAE